MLFSSVLFFQTPPLPVLGSLVPVVGGVVLASMTEVSFNWLVVLPFMKFQCQRIGEILVL